MAINQVNQTGSVPIPSTEVKQPTGKSYLLNQEIKDTVSFGHSEEKEESGSGVLYALGTLAVGAAAFFTGKHFGAKGVKEAAEKAGDLISEATKNGTKEAGKAVENAVTRTKELVYSELHSVETNIKTLSAKIKDRIQLNENSPSPEKVKLEQLLTEHKEALTKKETLQKEIEAFDKPATAPATKAAATVATRSKEAILSDIHAAKANVKKAASAIQTQKELKQFSNAPEPEKLELLNKTHKEATDQLEKLQKELADAEKPVVKVETTPEVKTEAKQEASKTTPYVPPIYPGKG